MGLRCTDIGRLSVYACLMLSFMGCASIVSGRKAEVAIDSMPSNAQVVVRDRAGKEVTRTATPTVVSLKRGYGMLPAKYTAHVEAPGHKPEQVAIKSKLNPWVFGNVVFGGLIGLAVDDGTGAMWKPKKDSYAVKLEPETAGEAKEAVAGVAQKPSGRRRQ